MRELLTSHAYLLILVFFVVVEIMTGKFFHPEVGGDEATIDVVSVIIHLVSRPLVYVLVFFAASSLAPQARNVFAGWSYWAWTPVFLIGEDMAQYWWRRLGHTRFGWLWHRAHHSARFMDVRVTLRNGFLYTFLMPSLWLASAFVFLGVGSCAFYHGLVKGFVTIAAHSEMRWDLFLYRNKILAPLAWLVERTISSPTTHFSHHALSEADGIGCYNCNFGNLLFFWDVLFGTALITRRYPPAFGVEDDLVHGPERWMTQLFFPLFGSKREASDYSTSDLWFRRRGPEPAE